MKRFKVLGGFIGVVMLAAVVLFEPHVKAQTANVKNYFSLCSGGQCDNVLNLTGTWKIGTTTVSAVAAELNYLAGVTPGTAAASKVAILGANKNLDTLVLPASGLYIGAGAGTAVTPTAAELNVNAGVVAGTATASKTAVLGANKNLDTLVLPASGLFIGAGAGTAVTPTAAELNVNAGVTPGTAAASKTLVVDANVAVAGVKVALGGAVTTSPGTSVGGLTDSTSTVSGTVQSTEYALNSVTVKANGFNANGRALHCEFWGTGAANANTKNYKVYFGATAISTLTGTTDSGKDYLATLDVVRTGASTQTAKASVTSDVGAPDALAVNGAVAETDTADIIVSFKSANTAAAATSATGKGASCYFVN